MPRWYAHAIGWLSVGLALWLCVSVGTRGAGLVLATLVTTWPVMVVVSLVSRWLVPPQLQFSGEFRD